MTPSATPTQTVVSATAGIPKNSPFWSIERFVAFVLGPIVTAAAGLLSLEAAKLANVQISPNAIAGLAGTASLSAGAGIFKWLDGRQFPAVIKAEQLTKAGFAHLAPFANDVKLIPGAKGELEAVIDRGENVLGSVVESLAPKGDTATDETIRQAVGEMRDHLEQSMHAAVSGAIEKLAPAATDTTLEAGKTVEHTTPGGSWTPAPTDAVPTAESPPIPPAANDPAPATPVQGSSAGQAADAGAAPTQ